MLLKYTFKNSLYLIKPFYFDISIKIIIFIIVLFFNYQESRMQYTNKKHYE